MGRRAGRRPSNASLSCRCRAGPGSSEVPREGLAGQDRFFQGAASHRCATSSASAEQARDSQPSVRGEAGGHRMRSRPWHLCRLDRLCFMGHDASNSRKAEGVLQARSGSTPHSIFTSTESAQRSLQTWSGGSAMLFGLRAASHAAACQRPVTARTQPAATRLRCGVRRAPCALEALALLSSRPALFHGA